MNIAASSHIPSEGNVWGVDVRLKMDDDKFNTSYFSADENSIETLGLELKTTRYNI